MEISSQHPGNIRDFLKFAYKDKLDDRQISECERNLISFADLLVEIQHEKKVIANGQNQ